METISRAGDVLDLNERELSSQFLSDSIPLIVWKATPEGKLKYHNQRWFEYTGMTLEQSRGGGWMAVIHPEDLQRIVERWAKSFTSGTEYEAEKRFRRGQDGAFRWHLGRALPRRDASGAIIEWIGTYTDIHDQKMAAAYLEETQNAFEPRVTERTAQLQSAKEAAEAATSAKSEFLANISHEIRTPITAIIGFTELMLDAHLSTTDRTDYVHIVRRNAKHLLDVINDILDLSKIEAGKMTVEKIDCDVPRLMADVLSTLRPRAADKAIKIGVQFVGKIPRVINTDQIKFRQILVNLLGNAIKFTEKGSVSMAVRFEAGDASNLLHVHVQDSGIGMSPEEMQLLFSAFTQADKSTTRRFGGTGLGLTISRRLARFLGGDIRVQSAQGVGSTFSVSIDCGPSIGMEMLDGLSESGLPASVMAQAKSDLTLRGRILLAEDGRDNQRLLTTHLRAAGASVTVAENGRIAVDLATTIPFDLILMDMQMPEMDGYTATAELRRLGVTVPIIALTAHAMAEDRVKCIESGCSDYLSKPVTQETLLQTVALHLGQSVPTFAPEPCDSEAVTVTDGGGTIDSTMSGIPALKKIIAEFVEGLPDEVAKLIELARSEDLLPLRRAAHQLRGTGGGYGFDAITESAAKVEDAIHASDLPGSIRTQVDSLIDVIRRVKGFDPRNSGLAKV